MDIISLLLIALSLALDASAVSLATGAGHMRITYGRSLFIACMFGLFQFGMPLLGYLFGFQFAGIVETYAHWIAFGLLSSIGVRMVYLAFSRDATEQTAHKKNIFHLSVLLLLALATSIDAFVVGITFAFLDVAIFSASAIIGVVTFALSFVSVYIGKKFGELFGDRVEVVGGAVLIVLGLKILVEGLF
ncbi:MAG: manganese efflux pump MntP family protein [Candidatus Magasanikbacteria bacterium]